MIRVEIKTLPYGLGRAMRNRHRHAIEQASRRWRGGRRDDSARTRRKILISTQVLKKRLWHVGNVLLKMHNCLQLRGEFIALSPLLRKCFTRVKYILSDDINANVDENAILGERVDSSDDLATMATLEEEASAAAAQE